MYSQPSISTGSTSEDSTNQMENVCVGAGEDSRKFQKAELEFATCW